jgi:hypothetical protein
VANLNPGNDNSFRSTLDPLQKTNVGVMYYVPDASGGSVFFYQKSAGKIQNFNFNTNVNINGDLSVSNGIILGGVQRTNWPTDGGSGANGTNGVNGTNGTNGAPGVNGTNGANGLLSADLSSSTNLNLHVQTNAFVGPTNSLVAGRQSVYTTLGDVEVTNISGAVVGNMDYQGLMLINASGSNITLTLPASPLWHTVGPDGVTNKHVIPNTHYVALTVQRADTFTNATVLDFDTVGSITTNSLEGGLAVQTGTFFKSTTNLPNVTVDTILGTDCIIGGWKLSATNTSKALVVTFTNGMPVTISTNGAIITEGSISGNGVNTGTNGIDFGSTGYGINGSGDATLLTATSQGYTLFDSGNNPVGHFDPTGLTWTNVASGNGSGIINLNLHVATNAFAGPTNSLAMGPSSRYTTLGNVGITNVTGAISGDEDYAALRIYNASGSNTTLYVSGNFTSSDGARSWVLTNGITTRFAISRTETETNISMGVPFW